jgi:hypothetical protein
VGGEEVGGACVGWLRGGTIGRLLDADGEPPLPRSSRNAPSTTITSRTAAAAIHRPGPGPAPGPGGGAGGGARYAGSTGGGGVAARLGAGAGSGPGGTVPTGVPQVVQNRPPPTGAPQAAQYAAVRSMGQHARRKRPQTAIWVTWVSIRRRGASSTISIAASTIRPPKIIRIVALSPPSSTAKSAAKTGSMLMMIAARAGGR